MHRGRTQPVALGVPAASNQAGKSRRASVVAMRAIVLCEDGFEDTELTTPYHRLLEVGFETLLAGRDAGIEVTGKNGITITTDISVEDVEAEHVDVLVIPGGGAPDVMRTQPAFVALARDCMDAGTLVATICHGPQLLIEAGVVAGRRMTSWPSIRTDLENAGAEVVDEPVVVDGHLITSRGPDDLPVFDQAMVRCIEERGLVLA